MSDLVRGVGSRPLPPRTFKGLASAGWFELSPGSASYPPSVEERPRSAADRGGVVCCVERIGARPPRLPVAGFPASIGAARHRQALPACLLAVLSQESTDRVDMRPHGIDPAHEIEAGMD